MFSSKAITLVLANTSLILFASASASAEEAEAGAGEDIETSVNTASASPVYLQDRGTGIPTSMFGTYVNKGELLVYAFYEYYSDNDFEYEAQEFGYGSFTERRGKYSANEGLIFLGYGITDWLAVEFEVGVISAELNKSSDDMTALPAKLKKSGLSDVEGQFRARWNRETLKMPEFFNYFEVVFPTGDKRSLIGTSDWEFKLGGGVIKGFKWGTVTFRLSVEYDEGEKKVDVGEFALEYLKQVSETVRLFTMIEGTQDEVSIVPEVQWNFFRNMTLKAGSGFGLTSKATDFAPEVGIVFSFGS